MFRVQTVGKRLLLRSIATIRSSMTLESWWICRNLPPYTKLKTGHSSFRMLSVDAKDEVLNVHAINVVNVGTIDEALNMETNYVTAKEKSSMPVSESIKVISSQIIPLVEIYRNLYKHASVPLSFIIPAEAPWPSHTIGFTLGSHLNLIRKNKKYVPWADELRLTELGVRWSQKEILRVEKFTRAVETYQTIFGDVNIPDGYEVPIDTEDWPADLRGYPLSTVLTNIQRGKYAEHLQRFYSLGLEGVIKGKHDDMKKAVEVYRSIHGHGGVPLKYKIDPHDERYPASVRGRNFGKMCWNLMFQRKINPEDLESFKAMGLHIVRERDQQVERICAAIECFQKVYGTTRKIPSAFVVPEGSSSYPPELWGMKLGRKVVKMKAAGTYKKYHDRFQALGIGPNDYMKHDLGEWREDVIRLLPIYNRMYETTAVPLKFVVPPEEPWPEEYHEFPLGKKVNQLRKYSNQLTDRARKVLSDLGMIWSMRKYHEECLDQGIEVFKTLHGHVRIPQEYVVPVDDRQWPRRLWGYPLGNHFLCVGLRRLRPERAERWAAMGVEFTPRGVHLKAPKKQRTKYPELPEALRVFHAQHGHYEVPKLFSIAKEDTSYPECWRGKSLWAAVEAVRNGRCTEYNATLEAMGVRVKRRYVIEAERICEAVQYYRRCPGVEANAIPPRKFVVPKNSENFPEKLWGLALGKLCHEAIHKKHLLKARDMFIATGLIQAEREGATDKVTEGVTDGERAEKVN